MANQKIIQEAINANKDGKLTLFDLSSFMRGPSLSEVYNNIDRTMEFFSVYVAVEPLNDNLWTDERYVEKEEVLLCSLVEEKSRRYWIDRQHEHFKRIDEQMDALRDDHQFSNLGEGELRDAAIDYLSQEVYPQMIELLKAEFQNIYGDKWKEYWEKEDPYKVRIEHRYHRRYDMPPPFCHRDTRNRWQQYYFAKDKNNIFRYVQIGSGSSEQRYRHGFYGHLFALLNAPNPVPTYYDYDEHNNFKFKRKEDSLWLNHFDLNGNFEIDYEESSNILKHIHFIKDKN
ncbi:MAG: hypothetical protein SWH68_00630 [Thermodesulfobacteriota bacterium]|nr:hypothetical protein [Thermodesulfobacteriota bacterium]